MRLTWKHGGALLGLVFFTAVWLSKPVGISTEFVVTSGIIWNAIQPGLVDGATSTNDYLASGSGSMAKSVDSPLSSYGLYFASATFLGGLISYLLRSRANRATDTETDPYTGESVPASTGPRRHIPDLWRSRFGDNQTLRLATAFVGGVVVLYGARLADGCTSGHMMSGMMQTSISGYIFAAAAFGTAVPIAYLIYRKVDA